MNNRFKFRVWDKLAERMIYPHNDNQQHFIIDLNGQFHNLQNGSGGDDYVIQQYTGLTDKNGKEIYEGDIVQYNQNSSYDNMNFIAKWSDDKLGFIFQSNSGEQLVNQTPHLNRFKHLEVVGNIFEHSELLK
jgi:uncharacterized phage protein (TIGR01671 family)